jgi:hypothetical protein
MLTQQRASGALEIGGQPGGTIFLSGGYLTFAESPFIPDLRSRLISSGRLTPDQWNHVVESDQAHGGVGALLVSQAVVTRSELRDLLWSVALDALIALTPPLSAEPSVAGVRFWPRRSHWIGSLLRLDTASLWADAEQKAELLAQREIPAGACPQLCRLQLPWAVVKREPWAIAWQLDGLTSVRDLAWRNGFALYDTMQWVGDLVQAGLCTMAPAPAPASALAPAPAAPAVPGQAPPGDPFLRLPRREPGAALAARSARPEPPDVPRWHAEDIPTPPDTSHSDLLRRILRGLRRTE